MRVLVVGARGFVGAEVAMGLLRRGHSVVAVEVRPDPGRLAPVAQDIEWHYGSCAEPDVILNAIGRKGIDAIYYGPFFFSGTNPLNINTEFAVMGAGALSVFNLARTMDIKRIVFPSSTGVHGIQPPGWAEVDEESHVKPFEIYGATKLLCERWGLAINTGLGRNVVASLRLPSIYGPGADIASRRVNVPAVQAARGLPGRVDFRADTKVCIAHVEDTAELIIRMMEADNVQHSLYGLGGLTVSFGEIADMVRRFIPEAVTEFGEEPISPLPSVVNWSRAGAEFAFRHRSLEDGVASIIDYERAKSARRAAS